jgi:hypothetical protein
MPGISRAEPLVKTVGPELGYQYNRNFIQEPSVNVHRAFTG